MLLVWQVRVSELCEVQNADRLLRNESIFIYHISKLAGQGKKRALRVGGRMFGTFRRSAARSIQALMSFHSATVEVGLESLVALGVYVSQIGSSCLGRFGGCVSGNTLARRFACCFSASAYQPCFSKDYDRLRMELVAYDLGGQDSWKVTPRSICPASVVPVPELLDLESCCCIRACGAGGGESSRYSANQ